MRKEHWAIEVEIGQKPDQMMAFGTNDWKKGSRGQVHAREGGRNEGFGGFIKSDFDDNRSVLYFALFLILNSSCKIPNSANHLLRTRLSTSTSSILSYRRRVANLSKLSRKP